MSARTWVIMLVLLAINWGGFIAALVYGFRRETRKRQAATSPRTGPPPRTSQPESRR